ncbi:MULTISPECIES: LysR substrate-binding domain-containing protein [Pseudomonas]|jgi:DNA-binding transcriptional LysR family regulator|uniref:LysR substrate-binding domain-containing protein n=1 Tax=Pseudomonas TaxID=286 RepID=UPI000990000D|nr:MULTISPECIES: LysR substrate-binding domain-containing protein [Pseudomonas]PIB48717.1 LysR family transcriptional regulator [Pseudomonas sp. 2588-5]AQT95159.1 LysR family transcriptional regulator [Pseudomonas azotoformans]MBT1262350.1 LysR family transcriptional regulator [Pseudomonas sp. VS40]MBT1274713.1 LysR family transcriptional regulator [Pseudomonas sp. VS59]PJK32248.1 LysR family transcriptional regulator [Pseudomonas sp. S09F 262]
MIRIDDLGLFLRSAALGSFTAAAVEADLLPGQVAAAIKRLERELEVRLFTRTTRSLRLSAEGEQYLPTARSVLEHLEQGRANLHGDNAPLRGTLQIAAPSDLGRNILLPWLTEFRRLHPELNLRFLLSDHVSNLFRDPVDVAIRYGLNEDANYIALPLVPGNRRVLVASPDYLARQDAPRTPQDLSRHTCLPYLQSGRLHDRWQLGTQTVHVAGPLFSDDADVVRRWALEGEGIAYKSWLDVSADVQAGRLVVLLTDYPGDVYPLSFACPHRGQVSRSVTALHQWLRQRFSAMAPFAIEH